MRICNHLASCLLAVTLLTAAPYMDAQAPAHHPSAPTQQSPAQIYGAILSQTEKEMVDLAEAMPADKYNFVPKQGEFKTVRSFGEQLKHVTQANYFYFGGLKMTAAEERARGAAIPKLQGKTAIVQALKDSFRQAHATVDAMGSESAFLNRGNGTPAGMVTLGLAHVMDHYGQLVVYLRLNGLVPPASRSH